METFIAWIMIGVISTGQAKLTSAGPFDTRDHCDEYLEDFTAAIEQGNSTKPPDGRLNVAAFCLATGKGV